MKSKLISLILATFLLVSLSGCDSNQGSSSQIEQNTKSVKDNNTNNNDTDSDKEQVEKNKEDDIKVDNNKKVEDKEEKTAKLYFMDSQAENLVEKDIKLNLKEGQSLEEAIVYKLKEDTNSEEFYKTIGENIKINSVKVEDKTAIVDISSENLSGGSTEEVFLIDSIVASLTSLDTIEKVQFLVDGQKVETLMGHMETLQPFSKENISKTITKSE